MAQDEELTLNTDLLVILPCSRRGAVQELYLYRLICVEAVSVRYQYCSMYDAGGLLRVRLYNCI